MATLSGYTSPPKTLSGIVDVNASTAQIGDISLSSGNISGITNLSVNTLVADDIVAGTQTFTNTVAGHITSNSLTVSGNTILSAISALSANFSSNVSVSGNTSVNHLVGTVLYATDDIQIKSGDGAYEYWGVKGILSDMLTNTQDISYNPVYDYTIIDNDLKVGENLTVVGNITQNSGSTSLFGNLTISGADTNGIKLGNSTGSTMLNMYHTGSQGFINTSVGDLNLLYNNAYVASVGNASFYCHQSFTTVGSAYLRSYVYAGNSAQQTLQLYNHTDHFVVNSQGNIKPVIFKVGGNSVIKYDDTLSTTFYGNITQSGGVSSLKALTVPSITCSGTISGNLTTSAQPNITSVGNLTGLTVTGTTNLKNVYTDDIYISSAKSCKWTAPTSGITFTAWTNNNTLYFDGGASGSLSGARIVIRTAPVGGVATSAMIIETDQSTTFYGNITQTNGSWATLKDLSVPKIVCTGIISGNLTTSAQPNITSVGNLTGLIVAGNISQSSGSATLKALTCDSITCTDYTNAKSNISTLQSQCQYLNSSLGNSNFTGNITVSSNITQTSGSATLKALTCDSITCTDYTNAKSNISTLQSQCQYLSSSLGNSNFTGNITVSSNVSIGNLTIQSNIHGNSSLTNCFTIGKEEAVTSSPTVNPNFQTSSNSQNGFTFLAASNNTDAYYGFGTYTVRYDEAQQPIARDWERCWSPSSYTYDSSGLPLSTCSKLTYTSGGTVYTAYGEYVSVTLTTRAIPSQITWYDGGCCASNSVGYAVTCRSINIYGAWDENATPELLKSITVDPWNGYQYIKTYTETISNSKHYKVLIFQVTRCGVTLTFNWKPVIGSIMFTLQNYDPVITQSLYIPQGVEIGVNRDANSLITSNALTVNGNINARQNLRVDGLLSVTGQSSFTGNIVGNVNHSQGTFISPSVGYSNVVQYYQGAFVANSTAGTWTTPTTIKDTKLLALLFVRTTWFTSATGLRNQTWKTYYVNDSGTDVEADTILVQHYMNQTGVHGAFNLTYPTTLLSGRTYKVKFISTNCTNDASDFFSLSVAYLGSSAT